MRVVFFLALAIGRACHEESCWEKRIATAARLFDNTKWTPKPRAPESAQPLDILVQIGRKSASEQVVSTRRFHSRRSTDFLSIESVPNQSPQQHFVRVALSSRWDPFALCLLPSGFSPARQLIVS